jgi:hypothetical protein
MAISHRSEHEHLQQLIRRDRLRKLTALLLLTALTGGAIYAEVPWVLALVATALAGGTAWQRRRSVVSQLPGPGVK